MPNFSSLARLEVPEKFLWVGGGWGMHSHFRVKPNRCVVLCWGWGFDNNMNMLPEPNNTIIMSGDELQLVAILSNNWHIYVV